MYVVQSLEGIVVQEQGQGGQVIARGRPAQLGKAVAAEVQRLRVLQLGRLRWYTCVLVYRKFFLRSGNLGTPKSDNCFELPSDWLLSY